MIHNLKPSLGIFFNLFKKPLILSMILVFISFMIITIIPIIINSYNISLEKSLATKQPHLKVAYISNNVILKEQELIKLQNKIKKSIKKGDIAQINSYVQTKTQVDFKSYGNNMSEYQGFVNAIGVSTYNYPICYDFDTFTPVMLKEYGFKITGIELFDKFKNNQNEMFFNNTLYKSVQPLVTYEARFNMIFKTDQFSKEYKGNFVGVVEDFFDQPIVYMNYKYLNKILQYDENHISGFMINIEDQKNLSEVKKELENFFNLNGQIAIVNTWRDENMKQNEIFNIFTQVGLFLKWIILILSTSAVTIYLYKSLLVKQPQLRLLNILGLRLLNIANITIWLLSAITILLATYTSHLLMQYIFDFILGQNIDIKVSFYIYDVVTSYLILVLFSSVIISSMFKQKFNIFK